MSSKIVVVDDEVVILKAISRILQDEKDIDVEIYTHPTEALDHIGKKPVDIILADYRMPDMDGVEFLTRVREKDDKIVRIVMSGQADLEALTRAINDASIHKFLAKDFSPDKLINTIYDAIDFYEKSLVTNHLAEVGRREVVEPDSSADRWLSSK